MSKSTDPDSVPSTHGTHVPVNRIYNRGIDYTRRYGIDIIGLDSLNVVSPYPTPNLDMGLGIWCMDQSLSRGEVASLNSTTTLHWANNASTACRYLHTEVTSPTESRRKPFRIVVIYSDGLAGGDLSNMLDRINAYRRNRIQASRRPQSPSTVVHSICPASVSFRYSINSMSGVGFGFVRQYKPNQKDLLARRVGFTAGLGEPGQFG